jgi:hypothetical protein
MPEEKKSKQIIEKPPAPPKKVDENKKPTRDTRDDPAPNPGLSPGQQPVEPP